MIINILLGPRLSGKTSWAEGLMSTTGWDNYKLSYIELCKSISGTSSIIPANYKEIYKQILFPILIKCQTLEQDIILDDFPLDIELLKDVVHYGGEAYLYAFDVSIGEAMSRNRKCYPVNDRLDTITVSDNIRAFDKFIKSEEFIDFLSYNKIDITYIKQLKTQMV